MPGRTDCEPLLNNSITEEQAIERVGGTVQDLHVRATRGPRTLRCSATSPRAADGNRVRARRRPALTAEAAGWRELVPAFMISELRRAFSIGFLIYLPFVAIDLIVASILMSAGMMMLPPVLISLPFKVIFFVLIDGWYMLAGSLMESYLPSEDDRAPNSALQTLRPERNSPNTSTPSSTASSPRSAMDAAARSRKGRDPVPVPRRETRIRADEKARRAGYPENHPRDVGLGDRSTAPLVEEVMTEFSENVAQWRRRRRILLGGREHAAQLPAGRPGQTRS